MRRHLSAICVIGISLSGGAVLTRGAVETSPRTVKLERLFANDPVKITKLVSGADEIKPGEPFDADNDWLNSLSIVIKNVSGKKIVFASVQMYLPDTGTGDHGSPVIGGASSVGQRPEHAMYSYSTGRRLAQPPGAPISIDPGAELTIPVISRDGGAYDAVKSEVESRQSLSSVRSCVVGVANLYFADGTKWAAEHYYRPDPNAKGKYMVISRAEFDAYREAEK